MIETVRRLCLDGQIYRDDYHEIVVDYRICELLRESEQPHVGCLQTRSLAEINEIVFALLKQIDLVIDNDHGRLIDPEDFREFCEAGTDWLRLPPG